MEAVSFQFFIFLETMMRKILSFDFILKRDSFTLKSGSTVCFLNEPIMSKDPESILIIRAYVDFFLKINSKKR